MTQDAIEIASLSLSMDASSNLLEHLQCTWSGRHFGWDVSKKPMDRRLALPLPRKFFSHRLHDGPFVVLLSFTLFLKRYVGGYK